MMSDTAVNTVVICDHESVSEKLRSTLADTPYQIIFESAVLQPVLSMEWHVEPELIVAIMDRADNEVLNKFKLINERFPLPIVIFTQDDRPETIDQAIQAGISAYVVDGFREERILAVFHIAMARFRQHQSMQKHIQELKTALADRKIIDRAKGLIMAQRQCSEDEAYRLLRTSAMNQNMRLADLARHILAAASLLEPAKPV